MKYRLVIKLAASAALCSLLSLCSVVVIPPQVHVASANTHPENVDR